MARETWPAMLIIASSPAPDSGATTWRLVSDNLAPVLPIDGAVAPFAHRCANAGQFWRTNCQHPDLVLILGNSPTLLAGCASQRVTAQSP
jgi:hypothetical protein